MKNQPKLTETQDFHICSSLLTPTGSSSAAMTKPQRIAIATPDETHCVLRGGRRGGGGQGRDRAPWRLAGSTACDAACDTDLSGAFYISCGGPELGMRGVYGVRADLLCTTRGDRFG